MPDFYAHEVFGAKVFAALPKPVQDRLEPEKDAWQCGLYGPDPLFFYHPLWPNRPCHEGHILHRQPPAVGRSLVSTMSSVSSGQPAMEVKDFAVLSLPKRMARLSKTARPLTCIGRVQPVKASQVIL